MEIREPLFTFTLAGKVAQAVEYSRYNVTSERYVEWNEGEGR